MPLGRARVHRDELLGISSRTHAAGGASRPAAPQRETPFTQRHASLCISHKIRAVRVSGGEDCSRRRQVWVREGETCSRWATEACRARKTETHQAGRRCAPPTRMCVWWGCFRRNRRAEVFWTLRLRRQNHIAQGGVAAFFNQCTHMTAEGDFTATDGRKNHRHCACGGGTISRRVSLRRSFNWRAYGVETGFYCNRRAVWRPAVVAAAQLWRSGVGRKTKKRAQGVCDGLGESGVAVRPEMHAVDGIGRGIA